MKFDIIYKDIKKNKGKSMKLFILFIIFSGMFSLRQWTKNMKLNKSMKNLSSMQNQSEAYYNKLDGYHKTLVDLRMGVQKEVALEDACKVEHDLSEESFQAIKKAYQENNGNVRS